MGSLPQPLTPQAPLTLRGGIDERGGIVLRGEKTLPFVMKVDDGSWMIDDGFLSLVQACVVARFIGQPHKWGDYKKSMMGRTFIAHDDLERSSKFI